jgi:hypothetical protein
VRPKDDLIPAPLVDALRAKVIAGALPPRAEFERISIRHGSRKPCAGCGLVIADDEITGQRPGGQVTRLHPPCLLAWLVVSGQLPAHYQRSAARTSMPIAANTNPRVDFPCPLCRDAFDREVILTAELDLTTAPITVARLTGCGHAAVFGELGPLTFEDEWRLIAAARDAFAASEAAGPGRPGSTSSRALACAPPLAHDRAAVDPGGPPAPDPADEVAVRLVHQVRDLMVACRTVADRLAVPPAPGEPSGVAGERIAYGVLVATLQEGLVKTLDHAEEVLSRFGAPAGPMGEAWLKEQEKRLDR